MSFDLAMFFLGLTAGFIFGGVAVMAYFDRLMTIVLKLMGNPKSPAAKERVARITAKINQAIALGKEQLELFSKLDGPNKGAAHSKWKNELGARVKDLEVQKLAIYAEIVAEGFDPEITVVNADGQQEKVKMSDVIKKAPATPSAPVALKPTATLDVKPKADAQVLKFVKKEPKKEK